MISQLHLPCPLIYQTQKQNPKKNTYIKFLLSREKGISEGRKEGSKQARDGFSRCLHAAGEGV
jgi:hypothetical protein